MPQSVLLLSVVYYSAVWRTNRVVFTGQPETHEQRQSHIQRDREREREREKER